MAWRTWAWAAAVATSVLVVLVEAAAAAAAVEEKLMVDMTLVPGAASTGAVCLDGSPRRTTSTRAPPPALAAGCSNSWVAGGATTSGRALVRPESQPAPRFQPPHEQASDVLRIAQQRSRHEPREFLTRHLVTIGADFYNWNRVKMRYCDGGSFAGDSEFRNGSSVIYMRGQRIWDAVITDLFQKGLLKAEKVLLSGCSAGGLATFFHCDDLEERLRGVATVKCMSDAGFFLDVDDISGHSTVRSFFTAVVTLQGARKNLDKNCSDSTVKSFQCFFPQYALQSIRAPYFILNSAYDIYQFYQNFVPPSSDPRGQWNRCKAALSACSSSQIATLQGLRSAMLTALKPIEGASKVGMFINSCFSHCQSKSRLKAH